MGYNLDMKTDFLEKFLNPSTYGTYGELQAVPLKTIKNRYHIMAVDFIGYLLAYLIIRSYSGSGIRQMLWYVAMPVFFDIIGLALFYVWAYGSRNRDESYYRSTTYMIGGVLIYSFMYGDCVLIYHDVSEILIFLLIPTVIACFYRDKRWFMFQVAMQAVFVAVFLLLRKADLSIHLAYVHPMLRILFFVLGIFQFSYALFGQDRLRLRMMRMSRELRAGEELKLSLTSKLDRECSAHIDLIDGAAKDILKCEDNTEIVKYAGHILEAGKLLRKAVTDADLRANGGGPE